MYARVSRYKGDINAVRAGFEAIYQELESMDGFVQAHFMVDEQNGRAVSITMWETEDAMKASAERAHKMRTSATKPVNVTIESVGQYEVAHSARENAPA